MQYYFKYYLLFFILVLWVHVAQAKKNPSDSTQHQICKNTVSINFLEPVLKLLSKNASVDSSFNLKAPVIFYGRQTRKMFYRAGVRISMKNKLDESDLFADKKKENYNRYDGTISALKIKSIADKIKIGYGLTATGFVLFDRKIFDSGFDKVTFNNRTWSIACGPDLFLRYEINKRLSLFTEYLFAYQFYKSYSGKEFSAFPDQNYANEKSTQHGIQFDYPITIYLTYHF